MNHSGIESGVRFKKGPDGFRGNIAAAREGDVRMKRAQIGFETSAEGGFLNALVQLEKVRMPAADPDPNDVWPAFAGKSTEADEGKEERFPLDGGEIFLQCLFNVVRTRCRES